MYFLNIVMVGLQPTHTHNMHSTPCTTASCKVEWQKHMAGSK